MKASMKHLGFACLLIVGMSAGSEESVGLRDWTVKDSIALRYFTRDGAQSALSVWPVNPVVPSPDRRHFFVTTRQGDLERDCNHCELRVFSVDEIRLGFAAGMRPAKVLQPVARGSLCSPSSKWAGMANPEWVDNHRIVFLSQESGNARNVYQFDIRSGRIRRLTDAGVAYGRHGTGVETYAIGGDSLAYVAPQSGQIGVDLMEQYPAAYVPRMDEVFVPYMRSPYCVFMSYRGSPGRQATCAPGARVLSVSPDGDWAMLALRPDNPAVSQLWAGYAGTDATKSWQYVLWSMKEHRGRPLFAAPMGEATTYPYGDRNVFQFDNPWAQLVSTTVLWSGDGRRVVVTNTALPLDENIEERRHMAYIVDYELETGRWTALAPIADLKRRLRAGNVMWLEPGKSFVVQQYAIPEKPLSLENYAQGRQDTIYTLIGNRWRALASARPVEVPAAADPYSTRDVTFDENISVNLRQSSSDPPVLTARSGARELILSEPDPALEGVWHAPTREVRWTEPDGREIKGLLMVPRRASGPLPLVIHAYSALPEVFLPDGIATTAYAAQPLVAQGFAVLFCDIPSIDRKEISGTLREGPAMVERIDAAVTALAAQGVADPARVGIVGFSRGAYMSYYAVTHPGKVILASAVVADGVTFSLGAQAFNYARMGISVRKPLPDSEERMYGGPFHAATAAWLQHDPSLNAHRARTPTLFAYNGRHVLFYGVDTVGHFRVAGCPAELLLIHDGSHQVLRPRERQASLEATLDWMNFWIRGVQDPDPAKVEMYRRWARMRFLQKDVHRQTETAASPSDLAH